MINMCFSVRERCESRIKIRTKYDTTVIFTIFMIDHHDSAGCEINEDGSSATFRFHSSHTRRMADTKSSDELQHINRIASCKKGA